MAGDADNTPSTSTSTSASTSWARAKAKPPVELRLKAREQLTSGKWDNNSKVVLALEENALCTTWARACPALRHVVFPSKTEWRRDPGADIWVAAAGAVWTRY